MGKMQIYGRLVGNGLDRSVRFYPILRNIREAAAGGIYAAPTNDP